MLRCHQRLSLPRLDVRFVQRIATSIPRRRPRRATARRPTKIVAVASKLPDVASKSVGEDLPDDYDKVFAKRDVVRRVGIFLHPTSLPGRPLSLFWVQSKSV